MYNLSIYFELYIILLCNLVKFTIIYLYNDVRVAKALSLTSLERRNI